MRWPPFFTVTLVQKAEHPKIYTDNYYTSPLLYYKLYSRGINACGTARCDRKYFPQDIRVAKKDALNMRGHYDFRAAGPLLACVWIDKRVIYFLSTIHMAQVTPPATVARRRMDGSRVDVTCPPCLPDYQTYMRGVDRGDQLIQYYNVGRRSKKWWKRVYSYILEVCCLNAYVLDKHIRTGRARRDYLAFRIELAEALVGSFRGRARIGRPRSVSHQYELRLDATKRHWPVAAAVKRDCEVCMKVRTHHGWTRQQYRHESSIMCSECNVCLCVTRDRDCFRNYHTNRVYWT